jgi:hypothetical protein
VLISSDRHLLEADLSDVPVLLPRDFLTHLARAEAQSDS